MKRGMKKVMKDEIKLTREELHEARAWAQDESWVKRKKYENDPEYLACVQDILDNPVFQSMDQFIQHGQTTCKDSLYPGILYELPDLQKQKLGLCGYGKGRSSP